MSEDMQLAFITQLEPTVNIDRKSQLQCSLLVSCIDVFKYWNGFCNLTPPE